jgi:hypothetical protein
MYTADLYMCKSQIRRLLAVVAIDSLKTDLHYTTFECLKLSYATCLQLESTLS